MKTRMTYVSLALFALFTAAAVPAAATFHPLNQYGGGGSGSTAYTYSWHVTPAPATTQIWTAACGSLTVTSQYASGCQLDYCAQGYINNVLPDPGESPGLGCSAALSALVSCLSDSTANGNCS